MIRIVLKPPFGWLGAIVINLGLPYLNTLTIYNQMIIVYGQANRSGVGHAGYSDPEDDLNRAKAWLSVQQVSLEAPQVQQGSLDPALHRLEQQGWIKAHWAETETGRKAKFYSLTRAGRTQMEKEMANWDRLSAAINLVVRTV